MWRSIGAKATGASHATEGAPCQDAFAYALLTPDIAAIAVADGAGSAPQAKTGADIAVARTVRYLQNVSTSLAGDVSLWEPALRGSFDAARGSLLDFGRAQAIDPRDVATTLQVVLLGRSACCYGRIGDGAGVARMNDTLVPLGPAPANVFANETTFVTSAGAEPEVFFHGQGASECAVFTDGLQHLAMQLSEWKPFDPFFGPLFDFVRSAADPAEAELSLDSYLKTDKLDRRTSDDRALVIAVWTA